MKACRQVCSVKDVTSLLFNTIEGEIVTGKSKFLAKEMCLKTKSLEYNIIYIEKWI